MSKYSFSVQIIVDSDDTPSDPSIGLTNGIFEWFLGGEFPDDPYFNNGRGILARDGISPITKSVKIDRFGDLANSSGLNLKIDNTEIFWKKFLLAFGDNVSLHNSQVFVIEWNNGAFGPAIYSGVCDLPNFDKSTYNIPVRSNRDARDAQLSQSITEDFKKIDNPLLEDEIYTDSEAIGQVLPITFGENDKSFFLQTGDLQKDVGLTDSQSTKYIFPADPQEDPLSPIGDDTRNGSAAYPIDVKISNVGGVDLNNFNSLLTEGFLYLGCTEGTAQGEIGKVSTYVLDPEGAIGTIRIILAKPFSINVAKADARLKFVDIRKEYNSDFWNCEGFIDDNGNAITANADIYNYNQGYQPLPRFTLDINASDLNSNELIQDDANFESGSSDVFGFDIVQENNVTELTAPTYFDVPTDWTYDANIAGFYRGISIGNTTLTDVAGDVSREDEADPFQWRAKADLGNVTGFAKVFEYEVPTDIPDSFDECYVVMRSLGGYTQQINISDVTTRVQIKSDKWFGDIIDVGGTQGTASNQTINFPDNYSTDGLIREAFWVPSNVANGFSGYRLIDLGISSKDQLIALEKLVFNFLFEFTFVQAVATAELYLDFFSLGLLFKSKKSIDKGVYTPFKGRLYDEDIYTGVTPNWSEDQLINDPIGALAHVKYLQNYNNFGITPPVLGWGKEYPNVFANNLIELNPNADGSFVDDDLEDFGWYDVGISTQRTDNKSTSSTAMSKDICNRFFLMSWIGDDNRERVTQVAQKTSKTITEVVDQTKMISWGKRVEQDTRNIFCQPFVNYDFDVASKKFRNSMGITKVSSDLILEADKAAACVGMDFLSQSAKATLWDRARALYLYYGVINEPPKILSDHTWISKPSSAYWYLRKWLRFMGAVTQPETKVVPRNRFDFVVPYEVGRLWDVGTRINVKIPNITDDLEYEFLITSITKNLIDEIPTISVKGVLFDLDVRVDNTIQDSTDETLENWQDTTDPANENIQDEV
jgi:hypothetical protein